MFNKLTLGVCYYPEHWSKDVWSSDLDLMKSYGIEVVRVAEFAWSKFEKNEGVFDFSFFDEFIDLCTQKQIKVIFCTPTATPPAWLTSKYPQVLNCDMVGNQFVHGNRRHVNLNSPIYIDFTKKIVTALAEHYGNNSTIVGWQIDNEINCERDTYYSPSDHIAFRQYLQNKFKTLDNLNSKMGTAFWNQEYTCWTQVCLPGKTNCNEFNPHITLEQKRFISHTCCNYIKLQAQIIKQHSTNQFVTTNGLFNNLNYHSLIGAGVDYITYDNYPNFAYDYYSTYDSNGFNDRDCAYNLTLARSISQKFGIMEQQSGAGGWHTRMLQPMPEPNQMKLWALSAIALGADFISFFRWRTCTFGTEIYWHGLNDYSNKPNRRIKELSQINDAVKNISSVYAKKYIAQVAIIMDYDNKWDGDFDKWHGPISRKSTYEWLKALEYNHITYDFVYINDESKDDLLSNYQLAIYPHPSILTQKRADVLKHYVSAGGKIIFGARSGYKNIYAHAVATQMPGLIAELCGVLVEEYTLLSPKYKGLTADFNGFKIPTPDFNDVLLPTTATILATFDGAYYKGKPALCKNNYSKGEAYYFGASFEECSINCLLNYIGIKPLYNDLFTCSKFIQHTVRSDEQGTYLFFLNYKDTPEPLTLNKPLVDLISNNEYSGSFMLQGYQVVVFKI